MRIDNGLVLTRSRSSSDMRNENEAFGIAAHDFDGVNLLGGLTIAIRPLDV